ncbi:Inner membrane transport protein YdhC [Hartmannibacter diazotrophicus]|uniref:Bcr/CflA family efflux transporter n=1 Tax=Hartmannibacter diazotrophicus TaxID=1482074 RepID=A0A2C9DAX7_9HYPH|nr:multidrug effflux MFS transporter [Hartmannibacter diazotrophicus]SON57329.1 Inner membrane transport protein YdhC [Hartmannibacter diazotrophicus]
MTSSAAEGLPALLSERRAAVIGALLVALGPVSMALYTPAMPALVTAFGTTLATVKLSLTVYFAGFAFAQLLVGPLSDAFGRRPTGFGFMGLYLGGSLLALFAPSVEVLIAARLVQGIGAAAGVALSRAIVRDLFTGQQSARTMNLIGIFLAIGPAIAPTIGGVILVTVGWHAIFAVMVLYGIALVSMLLYVLPETNLSRTRGAARPGTLVTNYRMLLADSRFLRPVLVLGGTVGGIYAIATMLPFLLIDIVGLTPMEFGVGMLAQTGAFILGGIVTKHLLRRHDASALVLPGLAISLAGGLGLAIGLRVLPPSYLAVMGPVAVFAFSIAMIMPALTTDALAPFPAHAGSAAALMGFAQMGGGLLGSAIAAVLDDTVTAMASVLPSMIVFACFMQFLIGRRG